MKKTLKFFTQRVVVVSLLILLQILWIAFVFLHVVSYSELLRNGLAAGARIVSVLLVLFIMNRKDNPAVKLAWVSIVLLFPLFGTLLYLYTGNKQPIIRMRKRLQATQIESARHLPLDFSVYKKLEKSNPRAASQLYYIETQSGFPARSYSDASYYSSGEQCFPVMLEELEKARSFIFLEYFIIEEGVMWNSILSILEKKAAEGLDVRIIYDDVGTIFNLPMRYKKSLQEKGIKCEVFNPYIPVVSTAYNNRDHRKLLIIDGAVGFTGGINLADEYINENQRFGYWKDNGILIRGDAVHNMTIMFLRMWNGISKDRLSYGDYLPVPLEKEAEGDAFILPFSDNPIQREKVGESVYLNLINSAEKYIYFFTPYLIIDNEMATAMILAAKKGVDVRIITPGIPDKKLVYLATQSYYPQLVEGGVRIFRYRPGFVHSKCAVCDDRYAVTGTINLDYRSLYLHFENAVYIYDHPAVEEIRDDFLSTLHLCNEVTEDMCQKNMMVQLLQGLLRMFSPVL